MLWQIKPQSLVNKGFASFFLYEALFASNNKPYEILQSRGIELMLQKLGKELGEEKVHPHKFRRTLATKAIDKGMPIEQVQHNHGHTKIDTTLHYAFVN